MRPLCVAIALVVYAHGTLEVVDAMCANAEICDQLIGEATHDDTISLLQTATKAIKNKDKEKRYDVREKQSKSEVPPDEERLEQKVDKIMELTTHVSIDALVKDEQIKLEESCELPSYGKWCRVHVGSTTPFSMAVYNSNDIVSNSICDGGTWELSQQDVSDLGPPGHALDIGANIGFYSLVLAANKWTLTSFEPLRTNLALLEASLCANPELKSRITVNNFGLGSKGDHCVVVSADSNLGDGITKCGKDAENFHQQGYQVRSAFEIRRLDEVLAEQLVEHIDFVKIDVEGFECQVMAGAQSLLTKYRPRTIQSEVWPSMIGCLPQDYLGSFAKAHYKVAKDRYCDVQSLTRPEEIVNRYMCRDAENTVALLQLDHRRMVWLQL